MKLFLTSVGLRLRLRPPFALLSQIKKWRPFQSPVRFTFILLPLAARSEVCSIHYQLSGVDRSEVLLASSGVGLTTIPRRFEANLSKLGRLVLLSLNSRLDGFTSATRAYTESASRYSPQSYFPFSEAIAYCGNLLPTLE